MKEKKPHYIGHRKRIREKFMKSGLDVFTDYEALELILGMAIARKDVKPLAKELVGRFGNFASVLDAEPAELLKVHGVGSNALTALKLVKESGARYLKEQSRKSCVVSSPGALISYCRAAMKGLKDEEFRIIFLNTKNEVIDDEVICRGTLDQTVVYPRKVIERVIHHNAASVIFVHNHPSGNPSPSGADRELTKILKDAVSSLQIRVHDHMIIGGEGHFSFAEEGIL